MKCKTSKLVLPNPIGPLARADQQAEQTPDFASSHGLTRTALTQSTTEAPSQQQTLWKEPLTKAAPIIRESLVRANTCSTQSVYKGPARIRAADLVQLCSQHGSIPV